MPHSPLQPAVPNKKPLVRFYFVCFMFVIVITGFSLVALSLGGQNFSLAQLTELFFSDSQNFSPEKAILFELRLPRVLLSLLVGGGLALSGAVMQGVFRNPLADPGLVGVSAGAALGASFAIVLGGSILAFIPMHVLLPSCAFMFGLLAMFTVYGIAKQGQSTQVATLLLAGVALSAMCTAMSALLIYVSDDQELRSLSFWSLGSFSNASWFQFYLICVVTLPASFLLWKQASKLNLLLLGEEQAKNLGVSVEKLKRNALVLVSIVVSLTVATVGLIGFVGLIAPHVMRLLLGADHRLLLPSSYCLGAIFILLTDTFARTIIYPAELPIGVLTALLGCPFFIYLLLKHRSKILF